MMAWFLASAIGVLTSCGVWLVLRARLLAQLDVLR